MPPGVSAETTPDLAPRRLFRVHLHAADGAAPGTAGRRRGGLIRGHQRRGHRGQPGGRVPRGGASAGAPRGRELRRGRAVSPRPRSPRGGLSRGGGRFVLILDCGGFGADLERSAGAASSFFASVAEADRGPERALARGAIALETRSATGFGVEGAGSGSGSPPSSSRRRESSFSFRRLRGRRQTAQPSWSHPSSRPVSPEPGEAAASPSSSLPFPGDGRGNGGILR